MALLLGSISYVSAQEKLLFAGFGFTGTEPGLYPASYSIAQQKLPLGSAFDAEFLKRLQTKPAQYARITTALGEIGKGGQISVAFALDGEEVEYQKVNDLMLGNFTIFASIIAFDRETKTLISAYPFSLSYRSPVAGALGRAGEQEVFRKLYFTNDFKENVFDTWIDNFSRLNIREKYSKYIQVKDVIIDSDALQITRSQSGKTEKELKNQLANYLESELSEANQIPIVPSSIGGVANKMSYRFSNGNVELKLPSPDFEITLTIRGFRTAAAEESNGAITTLYRTLGTIKIEQPESRNIYIDEKVNATVRVRRPPGVTQEISTWSQYYKATLSLIRQLSTQFNKLDSKWLEENAARGTDAKDSFVKTSELFKTLK